MKAAFPPLLINPVDGPFQNRLTWFFRPAVKVCHYIFINHEDVENTDNIREPQEPQKWKTVIEEGDDNKEPPTALEKQERKRAQFLPDNKK